MTTPGATPPTTPATAPAAPPPGALEGSNPAGPPEGTEPGQAGSLDGHDTPAAPGDTEVTAADLGGTTDTSTDDATPTPTPATPAPAGRLDAATLPRTCPADYCNQSPDHTAPHGWVQNDGPPTLGMA